MIGTDLKIITPAASDVVGPGVDRAPQLRTNATSDHELLVTWLKSHRDGSAHTLRAYDRAGRRFLEALGTTACGSPIVEERAGRARRDADDRRIGTATKPATVKAYVAP